MSDALFKARKEHRELVTRLREAFPDASDADLADTIEGETTIEDAIAATLREALATEAMAEGLGTLIQATQQRSLRLWHKAEKLREAALQAAQECGIKNLLRPDFTATVNAGKRKVTISGTVPETFSTAKWTPDKDKIADALHAGVKLPFAQLSNAEPHWTIRIK